MKIRIILLLIFVLSISAGLAMLVFYQTNRLAEESHLIPSRNEIVFLNQLKNRFNLKQDVIISIGPYHVFRSFVLGDNYTSASIGTDLINSAYLFCSAGACYVMIDYEFYKRLSYDEKKFVIAHEFWHVRRLEEAGIKESNLTQDEAIQEAIKADTFASAYVDPKIIIQFLNVYCNYEKERNMRINAMSMFIKK